MAEVVDRNEMIDTIANDLEAWLKCDSYSFWDHIRDLEQQYLSKKSDSELMSIYSESI